MNALNRRPLLHWLVASTLAFSAHTAWPQAPAWPAAGPVVSEQKTPVRGVIGGARRS